jgi:hypothetical protein
MRALEMLAGKREVFPNQVRRETERTEMFSDENALDPGDPKE